jgi:lysozyme family protein
MVDLAALKGANTRRWEAAKLTRNFNSVGRALFAFKSRYLIVAEKTGVPWFFIAVVHEREASQSWTGSLAQGDPWDRVSTHVPKGRGPFRSWEDAAVDALLNCAPFAGRNTDWSIGGLLTECEKYNGLGYATRGIPSPYVWAGTDQYHAGKFTSDGVFNATVIDQQLGCAGLLVALMALDPTISFTGAVINPAAPHPLPPPVVAGVPAPPSITNPAKGSIGDAIAKIFAAIAAMFRRK